MKTKMMGLLIALSATLASTTLKAQTVKVDNQLGCSIQGTLAFYTTNNMQCGSLVTVMQSGYTTGVPYSAPAACGGVASTYVLTITRLNGVALSSPAAAVGTGAGPGSPVNFFAPSSVSCNVPVTKTVYYNGPLNFKVY